MTLRDVATTMLLAFLAAASLPAWAQTADQEVVSAVDSPDPVTPGAALAYTVTLTNHGPDPATNGGINLNLPSELAYQNAAAPAGFTCTTFGSAVSCTMPSLPVGTYVITINTLVGAFLANFPDTSVMTSFAPSGVTVDPNNGNNNKTATTTVDTAQIDLTVAVADSPDPVFPDGNITYTATVNNAGPDAATNVSFNVFNSGNLRFQSLSAPAGFSCAPPAAGATPTFTCSIASLAGGSSSVFTVVVQADDALLGANDSTVSTVFSVNGTGNETAGGNSETENTSYVTPDADVSVSVSDSPDPVGPDGDITYTATVTNNGPDPATNTTFSVFNNGSLQFQSLIAPAGFSCSPPAVGGNPTFSCTHPSFENGANAVFTVVVRAEDSVLGVNDGTVSTVFTASSGVSDPAPGNNTETEDTAYVTPDADVAVTVSDSPDPVGPDGDITYTATVTNNGPDTATGTIFSVFNNGSLQFRSLIAPAGFSCSPPAVGGNPTFSCTHPSFANGASAVFTVVVRAEDSVLGVNDGTVSSVFTATSGVADPAPGNNTETEDTAYVTPDADVSVTVSDSPDPVAPDGDITYTATVSNNGPDTATDTGFSVFNNGSLQFQSLTAPAGFTCTPPAVGAAPVFSCTNPSFANGASAVFTVVVRADSGVLGVNDGTVSTVFTAASGVSDPVPANNTETEDTAYVSPDADLSVTVSDAPDPVSPDGDIAYSVLLANAGPDAATGTNFNVFNNGTLQFQSVSAPAGFTCTPPAVGAAPVFSCTHPSFASGAEATFTVVVRADAGVLGANDGTVSTVFSASSGVSDPDPNDNSETEDTAYVTPDADLSVTVSDAPDPVGPDGTLVYTATMGNAGPDAATDATFSVSNNGSLQFQAITAPAGFTCTPPAVGAAPTFTCTNPSLAAGANVQFTLTTHAEADVLGTSDGTITTSFSVSSAVSDPDGTDNAENEDTAYAVPDADLAITASGAPGSVASGDDIAYSVSLRNDGPDAAATAQFSAVLEANLRFVSLSPPPGFTCTTPAAGANGTVTCSAASFAAGASAALTLVAQLDAALTGNGTVSQTFALSSATADPDGSDNQATVVTTYANPLADLTIAKTTTAADVSPGGTIAYAIVVGNAGPDAAQSVTVTDALPASLRFASLTAPAGFACTTPAVGATGTITCTAATLANGASATLQLTTTVAPDATGTISNSAGVSGATPDPDPQDNGSTAGNGEVVLGADLRVSKTLSAPPAPIVGTVVTYTITVTNDGPSAATDVVATDTLPAGLVFVSATPSQGSCSGQATVTCALGTLADGASATVTLQARITATSGQIVNSASATSDLADGDPADNTGSAPSLVIASPSAPGQAETIPVDSAWMLLLLASMLSAMAAFAMRRR